MLGLSQSQVAGRMSVQPTALSNWENGNRAISVDSEQVDEALQGGGVVSGLLWALGTPDGLEPSELWTKVFPGEPTPVWMWIRSPPRRLRVLTEWGVARFDEEFDMPPNGVFVTVGRSVPISPIVAHLSAPGWADFGRGTLPGTVPGAVVVAAISHAGPSSHTGSIVDMFFGNMADRFSRSRSRDLAKLNRSAPRSLASFFSAFGRSAPAAPPQWPPLSDVVEAGGRLRFERLRRARGLSLIDAVNRLADVTGVVISKDTLRRFESAVGEPHDPLLPAALDQMLGAGGHLTVVEIRADSGPGSVRLPDFWLGPVWLEFRAKPDRAIDGAIDGAIDSAIDDVTIDDGGDDGGDDEATIQLHWGDWSREVKGSLPMRLIYHYTERGVPLRISTEPAVAWRVGIGHLTGGVAINDGWTPVNLDVAQRALSDAEVAMLASLEVSSHDDDENDDEGQDVDVAQDDAGDEPEH